MVEQVTAVVEGVDVQRAVRRGDGRPRGERAEIGGVRRHELDLLEVEPVLEPSGELARDRVECPSCFGPGVLVLQIRPAPGVGDAQDVVAHRGVIGVQVVVVGGGDAARELGRGRQQDPHEMLDLFVVFVGDDAGLGVVAHRFEEAAAAVGEPQPAAGLVEHGFQPVGAIVGEGDEVAVPIGDPGQRYPFRRAPVGRPREAPPRTARMDDVERFGRVRGAFQAGGEPVLGLPAVRVGGERLLA